MNGNHALYPDEVEVAPGIYLTRREHRPSPTITRQAAEIGDSGAALGDNVEYLQEETARLRQSVELLLRSNQELKEADPNDPEFRQAIDENVDVIARQMHLIKKYEERIKEILGVGNISARGREASLQNQPATNTSATPDRHSEAQQETDPDMRDTEVIYL